jgi:sugar phosphate isomerase/epimerase
MSNLPIGVQLYTLRNEMEQDFTGTLKKVSEIGYTAVEFAGYGGFSAKELSEILKDYGLKVSSSHNSLKDLESKLDELIEYNQTLGNSYMICPWVPKEEYASKDSYLRLAESLEKIGRRTKENGITLCYHNHDFEFEKFDGDFALDILLENTDPAHLSLELDVYWAEFAGVPAIPYLKKHAKRCQIVHLKDMANTPEREFTELGQGVIDFDAVISTSKEIGIQWGLVEQDVCKRPPFESISMSYEFLKNKGYL